MIYTELGHLHRQRLAPQQAEEWYRKAIEAAPSTQAGHVFLGALFAIQGRLLLHQAKHTIGINGSRKNIDRFKSHGWKSPKE